MLFRNIGHLSAVLERVVDRVPDRHRIMDVRLVFDSQQDISGLAVFFDDGRFQHVPVLLNCIFLRLSVLILCPERQCDLCRVQFLQLCRV